MKIEQEYERSSRNGRSRAEEIEECWVYAPTYLTDDKGPNPTGEVSLFVRRYRLLRMPKGQLIVRFLQDVWGFTDSDAMVARIEDEGLAEMPADEPRAGYLPHPIIAAALVKGEQFGMPI